MYNIKRIKICLPNFRPKGSSSGDNERQNDNKNMASHMTGPDHC